MLLPCPAVKVLRVVLALVALYVVVLAVSSAIGNRVHSDPSRVSPGASACGQTCDVGP